MASFLMGRYAGTRHLFVFNRLMIGEEPSKKGQSMTELVPSILVNILANKSVSSSLGTSNLGTSNLGTSNFVLNSCSAVCSKCSAPVVGRRCR